MLRKENEMALTLLRVEEVALLCGVSVQSVNNWYRFKRENPDNEYARLIPDYITLDGSRQRRWNKSDVDALIAFKQKMPKGCKGVMGSVTQRYIKKGQ